ncbi:MAG: hypothetical protein GY853_07890 [PVC group bacterium]|nr:hypothetical protein [PVC group bacterium]
MCSNTYYVKKFFSIIIILMIFFSSGCSSSFKRYQGAALKFDIPLYHGKPGETYSYISLGMVEGTRELIIGYDSDASMVEILEQLSRKALEIGANAVINVKAKAKRGKYTYQGEAVIFKEYPNDLDNF